MRVKSFLFLGVAFLFCGCASHYPYGGAGDDPYMTADPYPGQSHPEPAASPTFRPGMNPDDPRDPHFTTRPDPQASPPPTK